MRTAREQIGALQAQYNSMIKQCAEFLKVTVYNLETTYVLQQHSIDDLEYEVNIVFNFLQGSLTLTLISTVCRL